MHLTSRVLSNISGIQHGFGTREEPFPESISALWNHARPVWQQVHGIDVAKVQAPNQECGKVDGLYTHAKGIPVAVVSADCVPILLAKKSGTAVAAIHAGWRGTRAGILRSFWQSLSSSGDSAKDWVAAIGPAIGPCCYEVSQELATEFQREFGGFVTAGRTLDLPAINAEELSRLGIAEIDLIRSCTKCTMKAKVPLHWSYRRDGTGFRQWSAISII